MISNIYFCQFIFSIICIKLLFRICSQHLRNLLIITLRRLSWIVYEIQKSLKCDRKSYSNEVHILDYLKDISIILLILILF